jgi:hypothetical protein
MNNFLKFNVFKNCGLDVTHRDLFPSNCIHERINLRGVQEQMESLFKDYAQKRKRRSTYLKKNSIFLTNFTNELLRTSQFNRVS